MNVVKRLRRVGRLLTRAVLFDADTVNEMKRFFVEISDFQSIITLGTKY